MILKKLDSATGFWKRTLAFLIDVIPITIVVSGSFYLFSEFKETVHAYLTDPQNLENKKQFIEERNSIRNLSGVVYLVYAAIMESSKFQATVGKFLLKAHVTDREGKRLSFQRALLRNLIKMVSIVPAFIGCLACIFNDERRAWHDRVISTLVVNRRF
jgi:uncharacterized RDD family membrane protein YckC